MFKEGAKTERILKNLEPQNVFYYFEKISRIPRGSFNEEKISNYLTSFAKERNLKVVQDKHYNVIIDKPATPGYENRKKLILQGHMDMVCVKDDGIDFDFTKDPINIYIDGDYIKARGTSLGADDGNALALCLALLDSKEIKHPPLQVIFTTEEEVGLGGAQKLDASLIDGDYLIGLDYSHDDKILVSCAGSNVNYIVIDIAKKYIENKERKNSVSIRVSGLNSGHSGLQVNKFSGNSIKILGELISKLNESYEIDLVNFKGGEKTNVIPASASCEICYLKQNEEEFISFLNDTINLAVKEIIRTDSNVKFEFNNVVIQNTCYEEEVKNAILDAIDIFPNGVHTFLDVESLKPESSVNLGIVYEENNKLFIASMVRSNYDYEQDELTRKIGKIAKLVNGEFIVENKSLSWEYNMKSKLEKSISEIYESLFKEKPEIHQLHAGVETGLLISKIKKTGRNIDAVNLGVKNFDVHTTKERMYIPSIGKTYTLLVEILEKLE